ncbi:MAG TPA: hypothetical protein VJG85_02090 [Patescibacteria group bacterium]|nr:hypothetical protein [Patescibacteria group bacterium]
MAFKDKNEQTIWMRLISFFRKIRKQLRIMRKNGMLAKIVVIVSSLALLATSVLPFIL